MNYLHTQGGNRMTVLVKGQKVDLTKTNPALTKVKIGLGWDVAGKNESYDLDAIALLLDANGNLVNPQNIVFYNHLSGGQSSVQLTKDNRTGAGSGDDEQLLIDLKSIPPQTNKIVIAINIYDGLAKKQGFNQVSNAYARIDNEQTGQEIYRYDLGREFSNETTVIVGEVYLHNGNWKFSAIGQGITGGLSELCTRYNLQTSPSLFMKAPAPKPVETRKPSDASTASPSSVNLSKIELKKTGDKINLNKTSSPLGEILVNLNWNQQKEKVQETKKGFLSSMFSSATGANRTVDLDLGCLFELEDGYKGVVQALGNGFGSLKGEPYIALDHDDRTGSTVGGENLRINGNQLVKFKRILVFAFIYEGAVNWAQVDGVVTLKQQSGPDIEVRLDEHRAGKRMCAIALLENENNQTLSVKKTVQYFNGHRDMDQAFNWGMNWQAGSK